MTHRPALAGHAAFETFSVLTRLPGVARVEAPMAAELIAQAFPEPCFLDARRQAALLRHLGDMDLAGGSVYDALVASAALAHGRRLLSRDERAQRTYRRIGVDYEWVGPR